MEIQTSVYKNKKQNNFTNDKENKIMELLFSFCLVLCAIGFLMAIISAFEAELVTLDLGIILCIIGLVGALITSEHIEDSWTCCGNEIHSEYCSECGEARPVECKDWTCCDHEYDSNIKFCPDCGKPKPTTDITNNIVVKDNENVNININDDKVVINTDEWICCDKNIESKFCPDCGKSKSQIITTPETEITIEKNE